MKLDPSKIYSMPLIMGPVSDQDMRSGRVYGEAESLSVTCRTDAEAARALVPPRKPVPQTSVLPRARSRMARRRFMTSLVPRPK